MAGPRVRVAVGSLPHPFGMTRLWGFHISQVLLQGKVTERDLLCCLEFPQSRAYKKDSHAGHLFWEVILEIKSGGAGKNDIDGGKANPKGAFLRWFLLWTTGS